MEIRYPQNWMLDENGNRFIDTSADRKSRIPLDEVIPLTSDAVSQMFEQGVDYELNYLVDELKKK